MSKFDRIKKRLEKQFLLEQKRHKKGLWHFLTVPISGLYRLAVFLRGKLFDLGILTSYKSSLPVISIGNIAVGGRGKTSFASYLIREMSQPIALLSRGYRSTASYETSHVIRSPEEGDEAYLLSQKHPNAHVIVGKKRVKSAKLAETLDVDYIILDDGMQHRYLARDIEIVMLDPQDVLEENYFLPQGVLREGLGALRRAHYIVVFPVREEKIFQEIACRLRRNQIIGCHYQVTKSFSIQGKKIGTYCGIGNAASFFQTLRDLGCNIVDHRELLDHEPFKELRAFKETCFKKGATTIVCTEKDYVKLNEEEKKGVVYLEVSMCVAFGQEFFEELKMRLHNMGKLDSYLV